tara:strand:+ start:1286 stop:2023 length:738 start_codon:yes stop_codon:yes gene_type:complete
MENKNTMTLNIKTKKRAKELGLRPAEKWVCKYLFPKMEATPVNVKGEEFYAEDQCEPVMSITAAEKKGMCLTEGAQSVGRRPSQYGYYWVYPASSFVPKKTQVKIPPRLIDLLQAVFTVNKSTKRYRQTAQLHYRGRRYGLAQHARRTKIELYDLKDKGIAAAIRESRLHYCGTQGGFALYRGEGYCFHSRLIPSSTPQSTINTTAPVFVASSAKGNGEARLKDAIYTLEQLHEDFNQFDFLPLP